MAAILNSTILDSAILVFPLKTHSHLPRLVPTICTKKNFTHTSLPKFRIWSSPGARSPYPYPTHLPHGGILGSFPHLATLVGPHYLWLKNHQGHCTNSLNGKASLDRRSKYAHAHIQSKLFFSYNVSHLEFCHLVFFLCYIDFQ